MLAKISVCFVVIILTATTPAPVRAQWAVIDAPAIAQLSPASARNGSSGS